jgi:hypothetical protein
MSDQATALNAMRVIDLVLDFYGPNGEHWLQGAFRDGRKRRCLVDAIAYVQRKLGIGGDDASWYIYEAIQPQIYEARPERPFWRPPASVKSLWSESQLRDRLMFYNDSHCKSFAELRSVLITARSRAEFCHASARHEFDRQAEINAAKAAADQKRRAAVEARWNLITQVQFERKSSAVRRITAHTYILCPRAPDHPQPEPLRLAA